MVLFGATIDVGSYPVSTSFLWIKRGLSAFLVEIMFATGEVPSANIYGHNHARARDRSGAYFLFIMKCGLAASESFGCINEKRYTRHRERGVWRTCTPAFVC